MCWALVNHQLFLTSQSDAPLSRPHIQSSTLQTCQSRTGWLSLIPQGCPDPQAFIFFSVTASEIAQQPSCTVFAVASTCEVLPAQLTGPLKLNSTCPLHFYRGALLCMNIFLRTRLLPLVPGPQLWWFNLQDRLPTMCQQLVIHSMYGKVGGWLPLLLPKSPPDSGHNNASNCLGLLSMPIYPQVIGNILRVICVNCVKSKECTLGDAPICQWYLLYQVLGCILWLTSMGHRVQQSGTSIPLHPSTCFGSILMFTHFVDRQFYPYMTLGLMLISLKNPDIMLSRHKGLMKFLQELKYNKVLGYQSQCSMSGSGLSKCHHW